MNRTRGSVGALVTALSLTFLIGVGPSVASAQTVTPGSLTGAGSTFINPLMSLWSKQYNTMYPNVTINYQSIGSGGGIQQFLAKTPSGLMGWCGNHHRPGRTGIRLPESVWGVREASHGKYSFYREVR